MTSHHNFLCGVLGFGYRMDTAPRPGEHCPDGGIADKSSRALFGISRDAARHSAELRAMAAKTVDRITGHYSTDVDGDRRQVESYLQQAYYAVMSA
jgi:hypothetical protein